MGDIIGVKMETQKRTPRERHERPRRRGYSQLARESEFGPCQVRIETDNPCPYPATAKIQDVPFCERCAREQEAYFAIGELTQARETEAARKQSGLRCLSDEPLVGMSDRARWKLVRRILEAVKRDRRSFGSLAAEQANATCSATGQR